MGLWERKYLHWSTTEISELSVRRGQTPTAERPCAIQESHKHGKKDVSFGQDNMYLPLPRKGKDMKKAELEGKALSSLPSRGECEGSAKTPHRLPQKTARFASSLCDDTGEGKVLFC